MMTAMGESGLRVLDRGDTAGPDNRGLFSVMSAAEEDPISTTPKTAAR